MIHSLQKARQSINHEQIVESYDHPIPPITDPLGKHWKQPNRFNIDITKRKAKMKRADFDKLAEYSYSDPTGVYEGKMWKTQVSRWEPYEKIVWLLKWFGEHKDPNKVSYNDRIIEIID